MKRARAGPDKKAGHLIIIAACACLENSEVELFTPQVVLMGEGSRIAGVK